MRQFVFTLGLILLPLRLLALEIEDRLDLGSDSAATTLRIVSTTDADLFQPVLEAFVAANPAIAVEYLVASSTELMGAIEDSNGAYDVAISSAMDLQTKLANDHLTQSYSSSAIAALPDWARWREDIFAFTQEPAAIVVSKKAFDGLDLPQTRDELIATLRNNPDRFQGRIGTYDLRHSGLGYLFATQDSRVSEVYWRLTEVMGSLDAKLYRGSSKMIGDVANGELALAYNVLGSYALSHADRDAYHVIFPADFTTVMMRTALIPATSQNAGEAALFIDFLLEKAWMAQDAPATLGSLHVDLSDIQSAVRRIRLGPSLLIFLDDYKRRRFISAWESSILQE